MYFATAGSSLSPGHISSFNIAQTLVFEMAMRLRRTSFCLVEAFSENAHNSCTVWYILIKFWILIHLHHVYTVVIGRILFFKVNNFSTNRHINSLPTLCFSRQESKHC